jgi:hypothetical protein
MNEVRFIGYPNNIPIISGYYICWYNIGEEPYYVKGIYFSTELNKWCDWKPGNRILNIRCYIKESHSIYYSLSRAWYKKNYESILFSRPQE